MTFTEQLKIAYPDCLILAKEEDGHFIVLDYDKNVFIHFNLNGDFSHLTANNQKWRFFAGSPEEILSLSQVIYNSI